jgi:ABC-2 type transport system permease protein/oleandomycin transport system permease protein
MNAIADIYLVVERNLRKSWRTPQFILVEVLVQPVIFVMLFAFVFGGAIHIPGVSYVDFLLPGVLVQTATFAGLNTAVALTEDLRNGLMDRFWSLPMSRFAVVVGRIVADTIFSAAGVVVMVTVGFLIGFRFHGGAADATGAIALAVLTGFAFAWLAGALAVALRTPEAVQGIGFVVLFPLVFASSTFVPVGTMPSWLQVVSRHSPITAVADAVRALSLGHSVGDTPIVAVAWLIGITAGAAALAAVLYGRMSR